jgi:hypothetical protein
LTDIFDEVEEEVRKARYEELWKKYGNYIMAVAIVVVVAVAGYRGWQYWQLEQNRQASDAFLAAQQLAQQGNLVAAESAFAKLAADAPSGYATVAKFTEAAVLLTENKRDAALVILRDLYESDDPVLSGIARLQAAWVEADTASKAHLQSTLAPLLAPDNAFRFAAQEILAYADLRFGNRDQALAGFDRLSKDRAAPEGLRERAGAIATYLRANPNIKYLPLAPAAPLSLTPRPAQAGPLPIPAPAAADDGHGHAPGEGHGPAPAAAPAAPQSVPVAPVPPAPVLETPQ